MFIIFRSSHQRCSVKKGALKKFANFIGKGLCWSLFLIKLQALRLKKKKKTPAQIFSCGICEISKNTFFEEIHCYCLRMLLTILLVLQYDLLPVSPKFCLPFRGIFSSYFSLVLFHAFGFLHKARGLRIRLWPPDKFQMLSLYLHL